jgi:hypothetical protein
MSRHVEECNSQKQAVGTEKFCALEAHACFYSMTCDVWSFGILMGEICAYSCNVQKVQSKKMEDPGIDYRKEDEAFRKWEINSQQTQKIKEWKVGSLSETVLEKQMKLFLLDLANWCLKVEPARKPSFKEILEDLGKCNCAKLDEEFVKHIQQKLAKKLADRIEQRVAQRICEAYKKFQITSLEWSQENLDESSNLMAIVAIDFVFVDLELEYPNTTTRKNNTNATT